MVVLVYFWNHEVRAHVNASETEGLQVLRHDLIVSVALLLVLVNGIDFNPDLSFINTQGGIMLLKIVLVRPPDEVQIH